MKRYGEKEVKWLIGNPIGLFLTRRSETLRRAGIYIPNGEYRRKTV